MDIKTIIGTVAPWIATAFGGPLGGMAVDAIGKALGLSDKSEAAIKQALSGATPEQMLALKKTDEDFQVQMTALGFKNIEALEKLAVDDRVSARQREMTVKDWIPGGLAVLITIGFFGVLSYMLVVGKPKEGGEALLLLLGSLSTAWSGIMAYYYGSTAGSAVKTAIIAYMKKTP